MPQPLPSAATSDADYVDLATHRIGVGACGSNSPPIVDFTRFEDTYRGPRNGTFEGLLAKNTLGWKGHGSVITSRSQREKGSRMSSSNSTKKNRRSSRGSQLRHGSTTSMTRRNTPSSLSTGLSRDGFVSTVAPQSASSRKPDPRSILVALREVEVDDVARGLTPPRKKSVESYFSTRELLEMHYLDQVDFEEREMVRQKLALTGNLEVEGRHGDLGMSIYISSQSSP
ncbi:hypothetical protein BJ165DRAFT_1427192 [Panaeolus papilionaceus]|nr:hypothetical protein BJ165DRAFT_1427192 [Panaeolus papilionaceus]